MIGCSYFHNYIIILSTALCQYAFVLAGHTLDIGVVIIPVITFT